MIPKVSADDLLAARMKLDSIATEIRGGSISFEEAARRYSTAKNAKQGGTVTNSTDGSARIDADMVKEKYFNVGIQGMDVGQVSNAMSMKTDDSRDAYRIVRLDKKYPAHKANLTDDYDNIQNAALATAKQKYMREWAQRQTAITYVRVADEYKDCVFNNLTPLNK